MTRREYGKWPEYEVWAGWDEKDGGYWWCTICKFDGNEEYEYHAYEDLNIRQQELTPKMIEQWLNLLAKRYPEIKPRPGFIRHLWSDRGKSGFHEKVTY